MVWNAIQTGEQWTNSLFNILILLVTTLTLDYAILSPARIAIDRQHELPYEDLIFYLVETESGPIPRDIDIQLHVAVANVGGRKAVLSGIRISAFLDSAGKVVNLPEGMHETVGKMYIINDWWEGIEKKSSRAELRPPFTLEPDDVVALRFRMKTGIDWTSRWTEDRLRSLSEALSTPIAFASIEVVFRSGSKLLTDRQRVQLKVKQQSEYQAAIATSTSDFTLRPDIGPLPSFVFET